MLALASTLFVVPLLLGVCRDSLAHKLLVILLVVLPIKHRSPEITDVCCHAVTGVLGVEAWVPCACDNGCAH